MRGKVIRKLKEKKIVVIIICVIILSIVYFLVQDAIDNFIFDQITLEKRKQGQATNTKHNKAH